MKLLMGLALAVFAVCTHAADAPPLKLTKTIPLPKVKGRFDHFAMDAKGQRLFVAALGNDTLEVLDVAEGRHLKSIAGLHKPTGVVFLPEANQIGVANGEDGTFKLFDGVSYELVNSLGGLDDADNVRRDAKTKLIYIGYGNGALGVIDSAARQLIGRIKLAGHPESFQLESDGNRIFVNVPDARQIAVIDRENQAVMVTWPMEKLRANFPMALDEANHRLFVGCRRPARLAVLDTATGQPVTDIAISDDSDDLFYDPGRKRLYASCGEGFIDVIEQRHGDHDEPLAHLPTRGGARTSFYSGEAGRLFLAVPRSGGQPAEIRIFAVALER